MRILIVDDSAFMRKMIRRMLETEPSFEIVDIARNGQEGVEKAVALKPDVVTLDIEMPVLDGLGALKAMKLEMGTDRPAVLMCSSLTSDGSHAALEAMRLGAADVIAKDPKTVGMGDEAFAAELVQKVRAIGKSHQRRRRLNDNASSGHARPAATGSHGRGTRAEAPEACSGAPLVKLTERFSNPRGLDLVMIGSSTGGPPVLEKIVTSLPPNLACPVVIAQHMPEMFTRSLAQRLDNRSAVTVRLVDDVERLYPGTVSIVVGGKHGQIERDRLGRLALRVGEEPRSAIFRPSVTELIRTGAEATGGRSAAMVMTGIGDDGRDGCRRLKELGGIALTQTAESCVVYGMPRSVDEADLSDGSFDPGGFAELMGHLTRGSGGTVAA